MKNTMCRLVLIFAGVCGFGVSTPAFAQDRSQAEALERLERRVNELAERQEQLMNRLGMQAPGAMGQRDDAARRPMPGQHHADKSPAKSLQDTLGLLFLIGIICNILLTIWIFSDIRKRGEGSGIFVAMALVAGIPAALIYALTRIGDRKLPIA